MMIKTLSFKFVAAAGETKQLFAGDLLLQMYQKYAESHRPALQS